MVDLSREKPTRKIIDARTKAGKKRQEEESRKIRSQPGFKHWWDIPSYDPPGAAPPEHPIFVNPAEERALQQFLGHSGHMSPHGIRSYGMLDGEGGYGAGTGDHAEGFGAVGPTGEGHMVDVDLGGFAEGPDVNTSRLLPGAVKAGLVSRQGSSSPASRSLPSRAGDYAEGFGAVGPTGEGHMVDVDLDGSVQQPKRPITPTPKTAYPSVVPTNVAPKGPTQYGPGTKYGANASYLETFATPEAFGKGRSFNLDPNFAQSMVSAIQSGIRQGIPMNNFINEATRNRAIQAGYWEDSNHGKKYAAAPPGTSNHQYGTALDMDAGLMRDYIRENAAKFGLQTIPDDPPHIQMQGATAARKSGKLAELGDMPPGASVFTGSRPTQTASVSPPSSAGPMSLFGAAPVPTPRMSPIDKSPVPTPRMAPIDKTPIGTPPGTFAGSGQPNYTSPPIPNQRTIGDMIAGQGIPTPQRAPSGGYDPQAINAAMNAQAPYERQASPTVSTPQGWSIEDQASGMQQMAHRLQEQVDRRAFAPYPTSNQISKGNNLNTSPPPSINAATGPLEYGSQPRTGVATGPGPRGLLPAAGPIPNPPSPSMGPAAIMDQYRNATFPDMRTFVGMPQGDDMTSEIFGPEDVTRVAPTYHPSIESLRSGPLYGMYARDALNNIGPPAAVSPQESPAPAIFDDPVDRAIEKQQTAVNSPWWKSTASRNTDAMSRPLAGKFRGGNIEVLPNGRTVARRTDNGRFRKLPRNTPLPPTDTGSSSAVPQRVSTPWPELGLLSRAYSNPWETRNPWIG